MTAGTAYHEPNNQRVHAFKELWKVAKDGSFSWEERKIGLLHIDMVSHFAGQSSSTNSNYLPVLRAKGKVAGGILKVKLSCMGRDGISQATNGTIVQTISADGSKVTVSGTGPTYSAPAQYWDCDWELKSKGVEKSKPDSEVKYELEKYQASRATKLKLHPPNSHPAAAEEIIVRHIRYLNKPDLEVTIKQNADPAPLGHEKVTLQITCKNLKGDPTGPVFLKVELPDSVTVLTPRKFNPPVGIRKVEFEVPSLAKGQFHTVPLEFQLVPGSWPADAKEGFIAVIAQADCPYAEDQNLSNNQVHHLVQFKAKSAWRERGW